MGSILGLLARVAFERNLFAHLGFDNSAFMDAEMALPILLRESLGVGFLGIVMSAYFSAILSTADSCLMAASGSAVSDFLKKKNSFQRFSSVKLSQVTTFVLGFANANNTVVIAESPEDVVID
jgi:SSS family solute:Na+ symporter